MHFESIEEKKNPFRIVIIVCFCLNYNVINDWLIISSVKESFKERNEMFQGFSADLGLPKSAIESLFDILDIYGCIDITFSGYLVYLW